MLYWLHSLLDETINYSFLSKKFSKFSNINLSGLYDLKEEINKEYTISYSYFDECFGINLDFNRKSYQEDNLKPQDILTIMFSFIYSLGLFLSLCVVMGPEGTFGNLPKVNCGKKEK